MPTNEENEKNAGVRRESGNQRDAARDAIFSTSPLKNATRQEYQEPWNIEPEIEQERQEQLSRYLATVPDIIHCLYPFKGVKLSRADVEWLLSISMKGRGPGDGDDERRELHPGLDLRGADLKFEDLHTLPLARLRGSLTSKEWDEATAEQRAAAAVLLTGANLSEAHLEQADLIGAHLEHASLYEAHLEQANLARAYLERAFLARAFLKNANLNEANMAKADLSEAYLQNANLVAARLEGAYLNGAHLAKADLSAARLEKAYLSAAYLEQANLSVAHLEEGYLNGAHLQKANLSGAHLEGAYLNEAFLEGATLYKAHLERTFLYKAHLEGVKLSGSHGVDTQLKNVSQSGEPHIGPSLADTQWGNVNLAIVQWIQIDMLGDEYEARQTLHAGKRKDKVTRLEEYEAAVRANRQLAVALRAQGLDEEAARFAYRAQILQRIVLRLQGKLGSYLFSTCLDLLAGYGYKPGRSLLAYLIVIFCFTCLYLFIPSAHLSWDEALVLSVVSFHGRGFLLPNMSLGDAFARLAAIEAVLVC
ncbi:pentapeptide repeat-containing protein [Ktedonobacter racemifer]|uniref:Pentapeptide repeat protein n=1 Tax=Ktedonobacter racemifer DSM 44963 TaxID=485913 RepID=D6U2J0_KTERA|nr:pentapeptide repeat-containing protein [Ktedonobacter racemifer]EFH80954.1 pentapeptide repeat protein [Ktedonobacter racemifer DSM 44963]